MKRIFLLLVLVVVATVWVGFARGWFALGTTISVDGKPGAVITVDQDKINADKEKAKEEAKKIKDKAVDAVK